MRTEDISRLVALLRARQTDLTDIEAKAAGGGLPKSVRDTLSAFSNDRGGTIILGLDESAGFQLASGFDAVRMRNALADACADEMEPPVRADVTIADVDGAQVVVADVPELDPRYKPCYVKARGEYNGSFTRGGDGDRKLTDFEIHLLHTNRGQPDDDAQPVPRATTDDLDPAAVRSLLVRVRERQRRAFAGIDDVAALRRLNVLAPAADGQLVPTLGGLLALGVYPQQFVPQLNATLVVYPGLSADDVPAGGPRFLDNRTFEGPIPSIVDEAVAAVLRNTAIRSTVEGSGRRDVLDYPAEALREVIANALVHRDYSPYSHGTPVQIVLYADRLTTANPGGLFGSVTEDDLGREGVSSTRNPVLAKLLQDVFIPGTDRTVIENRASGIPTVIRELRRNDSALPEFRNRITRFMVTLPRHALLTSGVVAWIQEIGAAQLSPTQQIALAQLREGRTVTNQTMRNLGLDQRKATTELGALVDADFAVRIGQGRHSRYVLGPFVEEPRERAMVLGGRQSTILHVLTGAGELTRRDIERATGLPQIAVLRALDALIVGGKVEATAGARSPHRRYRRAGQ
jgi:ATP-dependent DNA helicase RecG